MKSIDKINMILLQKGISGAELSVNAGLSNSAYSQWNTEKTKPSKKRSPFGGFSRFGDYLSSLEARRLISWRVRSSPAISAISRSWSAMEPSSPRLYPSLA